MSYLVSHGYVNEGSGEWGVGSGEWGNFAHKAHEAHKGQYGRKYTNTFRCAVY